MAAEYIDISTEIADDGLSDGYTEISKYVSNSENLVKISDTTGAPVKISAPDVFIVGNKVDIAGGPTSKTQITSAMGVGIITIAAAKSAQEVDTDDSLSIVIKGDGASSVTMTNAEIGGAKINSGFPSDEYAPTSVDVYAGKIDVQSSTIRTGGEKILLLAGNEIKIDDTEVAYTTPDGVTEYNEYRTRMTWKANDQNEIIIHNSSLDTKGQEYNDVDILGGKITFTKDINDNKNTVNARELFIGAAKDMALEQVDADLGYYMTNIGLTKALDLPMRMPLSISVRMYRYMLQAKQRSLAILSQMKENWLPEVNGAPLFGLLTALKAYNQIKK